MDSAVANFSWHGFVPVKVSKGFKKFSSTPTLMFPLRLLDTDGHFRMLVCEMSKI